MANRFFNPDPQFFSNSGQPLTGGSIGFYTTGTTTLATIYTNRALSIPAQNPIPLDSAGRALTDIFLDPAQTYKCILLDVNGVPIWTRDPIVDPAASINASLQVTAGNPNTQLAGTAGTVGGASASMAYDITNNLLYVCTTTGSASSAVWTLVGAALTGNEDVITASTYTVVIGDAGRIKTANNASGATWTLTAASTIGAAKLFSILNLGAGILTVNTSGSDKLDGAATRALGQYEAILIECMGSAYRTLAAFSLGSFLPEVTVASAATTNILGAASEAVAISGTAAITSLGTGPNRKRFVRATGAFTITYNATSLITPGAQNILAAAGDTFIVISDASSNARVVNYVPAAAVSLGFRNIARANGGLEVWQRGAGSSSSIAVGASSTAYTADRWYLTTGANEASTVSAQAGITNGSQLAAQVAKNNAQTGTALMTFGFPLDTDEVYACQGSLLALSFSVKAGANWSPAGGTLNANAYFGTGAVAKRGGGFTNETNPVSGSVNLTGGGSAQRVIIFASATAAANITQGEIQFTWTPVGTAGANDWFQIDDVQLEIITSPSSVGVFERLKFEEQLALCQRHFQKTFVYGTAPAQSAGLNTGEAGGIAGKAGATNITPFNYRFAPAMRATPTFTYYNPAAANAQARDEVANADCSATATSNSSANNLVIQASGNAGTVVGNFIGLHFIADAGI